MADVGVTSVSDDVAMEESVATEESALNDMKDEEYSVQYFGFHPQFFLNGMYNGIHAHLEEASEALKKGIASTFKDSVSETELTAVSCRLRNIAIDRFQKKFDKAEVYLRNNIFTVPHELVLPGDQAQIDSPCTQEDMAHLDLQLKQTTDQIMAVKHANAQLSGNLEEMEQVQQEMDTIAESLEHLLTTVCLESVEFAQKTRSLQHLSSLLA